MARGQACQKLGGETNSFRLPCLFAIERDTTAQAKFICFVRDGLIYAVCDTKYVGLEKAGQVLYAKAYPANDPQEEKMKIIKRSMLCC